MVAAYQGLARKIELGFITSKGNPAKYQGGFAALIEAINSIFDRFLTVIGNIPTPVVVLDKELKVQYMNSVAQEAAGSDFQDKTCKQIFNRDDDGSGTDALRKAVESKSASSGETRAHPRGRDIDITYTAIPMLDNGWKT
ncbi:hypothetical protein FACS1894206_07050 [Deltaproteobacteria bacterium]|nr:hypothetical protein FACS1894206_07050 [Deltaproteobacteria bacterium]